jgi:uncharacterized protein YlaI
MNYMTQPDYADNEVHSGAVNCDCCDKLIFPDDEIWETKKGKYIYISLCESCSADLTERRIEGVLPEVAPKVKKAINDYTYGKAWEKAYDENWHKKYMKQIYEG